MQTPSYAVRSAFAQAISSQFWLFCADLYPALVAASVPWSTTAVSVFWVLWFAVLIPIIDCRAFLHSLRKPASWLPLAFFALALIGMVWAQDPWPDRLLGLKPVLKFLVLPFLLYHFERSGRATWVLWAFGLSCALLEFASWIVVLEPGWRMTHANVSVPGVPVKNYIDQSYELVLGIFITAPIALRLLKEARLLAFASLAVLFLAILVTIAFVATSRTALIYIPVLAAVFLIRYFNPKTTTLLFVAAAIGASAVWYASPYLRERVEEAKVGYLNFKGNNPNTSTGMRLTWWRESLDFVASAPILGHGTGSIKGLMNVDGVERTGLARGEIRNPHNQTLYVAVQWGLIGCLLLYAMWFCHLKLFFNPGLASWIGLVVVVQNILSSIFNSHLFDFTEGSIYVLGVGVAGGAALRSKLNERRRSHEGSQ